MHRWFLVEFKWTLTFILDFELLVGDPKINLRICFKKCQCIQGLKLKLIESVDLRMLFWLTNQNRFLNKDVSYVGHLKSINNNIMLRVILFSWGFNKLNYLSNIIFVDTISVKQILKLHYNDGSRIGQSFGIRPSVSRSEKQTPF